MDLNISQIDRPKRFAFLAVLGSASLLAAKPVAMLVVILVVTGLILPSPIDKNTGAERWIALRLVIAIPLSALVAFGAWNNLGMLLSGGTSEVEARVAAQLRDPSSAQFRNWQVGPNAVCGEVNGKNAFGAYAGFRRFVHADGVVLFEPEPTLAGSIAEQTEQLESIGDFARTSLGCYQ